MKVIQGVFKAGLLQGGVTIIGAPDKYFVSHGKIRDGVLHGRFVTFGIRPLYDTRNTLL